VGHLRFAKVPLPQDDSGDLVDYAPRNENFVLVGLVKQRS